MISKILKKYKQPTLVASIVIIRSGELLLSKDSTDTDWRLPCNIVNGYRTVERTAKCCVKELLNYESNIIKIGEFVGDNTGSLFFSPILCHAYLAEIRDSDVLQVVEGTTINWFSLNALPNIKSNYDKSIISYIIPKFNFNLDRFRELRAQLNVDQLTEQQIYRGILGGTYVLLYDNNELVGMACAAFRDSFTRRQATIEDMVVDSKYRGKGFGDSIIQQIITWAKENRCDTMDVLTRVDNIPAKNLYIRAGFGLHVTEHYLKKLK